MIWLIGMASSLLTAYAIWVTGIEDNSTLTIVFRIILILAANILLWVANNHYEKLKSRIKTLEDKVEKSAEHIYQLAKKQSNKTIEYYVDCDREETK